MSGQPISRGDNRPVVRHYPRTPRDSYSSSRAISARNLFHVIAASISAIKQRPLNTMRAAISTVSNSYSSARDYSRRIFLIVCAVGFWLIAFWNAFIAKS